MHLIQSLRDLIQCIQIFSIYLQRYHIYPSCIFAHFQSPTESEHESDDELDFDDARSHSPSPSGQSTGSRESGGVRTVQKLPVLVFQIIIFCSVIVNIEGKRY